MPTKAEEAPSPHEVRLAPLDTNPVFQSLGENVKQTLRQDSEIVTKWFYENCMVLNSGKCHFMCLGQDTVNETFVSDNIEMKNNKEEKILGVIIDNKPRFKSQVKKGFSKDLSFVTFDKLLKRF